MSYDLCLLPQAKKPYYIENIRMNIYSLEELCFYLYNNACLIDESLLNERLLDWLRDELGLTRLYRQLYDQLEKKDGIGFLVLPIFREAGYLTTSAMREYQEQLQKLEVQSADMKQKLRGDYLVKERMYWRESQMCGWLLSCMPIWRDKRDLWNWRDDGNFEIYVLQRR